MGLAQPLQPGTATPIVHPRPGSDTDVFFFDVIGPRMDSIFADIEARGRAQFGDRWVDAEMDAVF